MLNAMSNKFDAKNIAMYNYRWVYFINGKYFAMCKGDAIEIPYDVLARKVANDPLVHNANQVTQIIDMINIMNTCDQNGNPLEKWPDPTVIADAKLKGPISTPPALPISVSYKEWVLLSSLFLHPDRKKFYIIQGKSNSGKSTFLNLVKQVYDNDAFALQFDELDSEFKVSEAITHRLICCDEVGMNTVDGARLKTITSHDEMVCNRKMQRPFSMKTQSLIIGACNNMPNIMVADDGVLTRYCYYIKNDVIKEMNPGIAKYVYTHDTLVDVVRYAMYVDEMLEANGMDWFDCFRKDTRDLITLHNSVYITCNSEGYEFNCGGYKAYRKDAIELGFKPYGYDKFIFLCETFRDWGYLEYDEDKDRIVRTVSAGGNTSQPR